jgi:hypothetical protein
LGEYHVVAAITEYLIIVKYKAEDNLYGLLFAPDAVGAAQTFQFEAKDADEAIFKGAMLAKEKGYF